jgi:hypothetical protein
MKQFIELGSAWIGTVIQYVCANVDLEVMSLPGGSLMAVFLWICAVSMASIRRAATGKGCLTCRGITRHGSTTKPRQTAPPSLATRPA